MADLIELSGQRFGSLVVLHYAGFHPGGGKWVCRCDCGRRTTVYSAHLRRGATRSCGCKTGQLIALRLTKHGQARGGRVTREHAIWRGMITRCTNPNRNTFEYYLGRGITVCRRWLKFENFFADMGPAPSKAHSIDRINNDKGYSPKNCRWADHHTQAMNKRKRRWYRRPNGQTVSP